MLKIHDSATPLNGPRDGVVVQIGWRVNTHDFTFDAVESIDGHVDTFVLWGDDQPGDIAQHTNWESAKRWLDALLQASRR